MSNFQTACEEKGVDINKAFEMIMGEGGGILPSHSFTVYFTEITDTSIICSNDKLEVKKEIPFSDFQQACFGIGNGLLWLQCVVDGKPFVFTTPRKKWKAPAANLLMEKISAYAEIQNRKDYERMTGKLFFIYMWK
ncbi:MAG: hypothetical protein J6M34_02715 [Clostridia bacterium]|nr:hypothetical protein [Clostridia bacterium]